MALHVEIWKNKQTRRAVRIGISPIYNIKFYKIGKVIMITMDAIIATIFNLHLNSTFHYQFHKYNHLVHQFLE